MNNVLELAYGPHKPGRSFTSTSTWSCTCSSEPLPSFNVIRPNTIGALEAAQAAQSLSDDELREQILVRQRLNAYGRKGGYGGTLLHSAAYLKILYTEWRRRELQP